MPSKKTGNTRRRKEYYNQKLLTRLPVIHRVSEKSGDLYVYYTTTEPASYIQLTLQLRPAHRMPVLNHDELTDEEIASVWGPGRTRTYIEPRLTITGVGPGGRANKAETAGQWNPGSPIISGATATWKAPFKHRLSGPNMRSGQFNEPSNGWFPAGDGLFVVLETNITDLMVKKLGAVKEVLQGKGTLIKDHIMVWPRILDPRGNPLYPD